MKTFALPPRNCCVNGHGLQSLTIHSVWISAYKQGLWKGIEGITTWDSKPQRGWKKNKYKSIFILTLKNVWKREDLVLFFFFSVCFPAIPKLLRLFSASPSLFNLHLLHFFHVTFSTHVSPCPYSKQTVLVPPLLL